MFLPKCAYIYTHTRIYLYIHMDRCVYIISTMKALKDPFVLEVA